MDILVAVKIVPDERDIKATSDGGLDFSKAHMVISGYDKNAIEAATMMAAGGNVKALSVGGKACSDTKVRKDILARGVDELFLVADDTVAGLDAFATAAELAEVVKAAGSYDAIVVGEGSADLYARQTGVQLAAKLGLPYVSAVVEAEEKAGKLVAKRMLEDEVETIEAPLPCVVSVASSFAEARICGMKDILAAGKKPVQEMAAAGAVNATSEKSLRAPAAVDRKREVFTDIDQFVAAVKTAL